MGSGTYAVYAIRYATDQKRRRRDNFLDGDADGDGAMPMDYFVWALLGDDRTIVVDTGFGREEASRRKPALLRLPREGLALLGVEAAAVADVVITHMHYDHAGTTRDFPSARFHIQEAELAFATGRQMAMPVVAAAVSADDACLLVRALFAGRVRLHDGDEEIAPGVSLHLLGGHTPGMQCVRVMTERGPLVLASDASHYYENMDGRRPFAIAFEPAAVLAGFQRMRGLVSSPEYVIPGHDPLVLQRFPSPTAACEGVIARLDTGQG